MMDLLQSYMMSFVGLPYRWGGDDPIRGYDCSGLTQEFLASVNMDPPGDQTAQGLYAFFAKPENNMGDIKGCGALCFYGKSVSEITHVAMMYDSVSIVEAGGGGSKTTSEEAAAEQNAFVRVRRFDHRKDLVAIKMPRYGYMKP